MSAQLGDHLFFVLIGLALPLAVLLQPAAEGDMRGISRPRTYLLSLVTLCVPACALIEMWLHRDRPVGLLGIGEGNGPFPRAMGWLAIGMTLGGAIFLAAARWNGWVRAKAEGWVEDSMEGALVELLPRTPKEFALFAGIVPVAALAEELLFRAFLLWYLGLVIPWWAAVLVAALIFGVCHGYQGPLGVVKTGTLGVILGLMFLAGGTLWPVVLVHGANNLVWVTLAWMCRPVGPQIARAI